MSETSDKAKAAAKLEAAKLKAEKLRALQEEAAREVAEAEAAEAAEVSELEVVKAKRAKEALHRSAEKQRLREQKRAAESVAKANAAAASSHGGTATATESDDFEEGDIVLGDYVDEPLDDFHAETGASRKRLGLRCFNCNRMEGHYLLFYRRLWYSYVIGLTFGLAVIAGPYRCQCCGSSRFMMSNLLHPKYYMSLFSTRSKSGSKSRSSRRR